MKKHCEFCGGEPPYNYPCTQSATGSHRWHKEGEKAYRVAGRDGYVYRMSHVPSPDKGFTLIEEIIF